MTGDNFGTFICHTRDGFDIGEVPLNGSAAVEINVWESAIEKQISHMDHIRGFKVDDRIGIGMPWSKVDKMNFLITKVDGHLFRVGQVRECAFLGTGTAFEPASDIIVGYDGGIGADCGISASVVPMKMGIEHIFNFPFAHFPDGFEDFGSQMLELRID